MTGAAAPTDATSEPTRVIEVFADVCCPFTHVGLRRFVARRAAQGRDDVVLRVRAWPLELVNGEPLDRTTIAEEIAELRAQVGTDAFAGFTTDAFPGTSLPAMALAASAYAADLRTGEAVSLAVRHALFEEGRDIELVDVLADIAGAHGLAAPAMSPDTTEVLDDYDAGRQRGVVGSPHFFTPEGDFFCPALDVSRDAGGHLRITADADGFDRFIDACFG